MASNLSTIGFRFSDEADFRETMIRLAEDIVAKANCHAGAYGVWQSRTGAEIWFHLMAGTDGPNQIEIVGLTPFFDGESDVEVRLTELTNRPDDNPFEGIYRAWVSPSPDGKDEFPIVLEAVDFALQTGLEVPARKRARITAFAHEVRAFADEAGYQSQNRSAERADLRLASKAFIPIGLFDQPHDPDGAPDPRPVAASAMFTGTVLDARRFTNEATGGPFDWVLVETLDATLDVVADPVVVSGEIVVGGTVEVSAVLFGRLLDER